MELPIEAWAVDNALPDEARVAIAESARCHKAGAYRAALLFGYVAWGLSVRHRLLSATCPNGVPPGRWAKLQTDLQSDDVWDQEVFDSTQTLNPAPIFDVPPDVRQQVRYWKDRRNDCAHYKRNQILAAHVEAFWAFMQSNLGRFVPNGSIADLLARVERHFDPNLTPPGQSIAPIVRMIPSAVAVAELPQLMREAQARLRTTVGNLTIPRIDEQIFFFDAIFASGQADSTNALVDHLVSEQDLFVRFICRHPERILFFNKHPTLIRELWRKHLFSSNRADLPTFAALLRNNLIPSGELVEACQRTVSSLNGDVPSALDTPCLVNSGWVRALRDYAFGQPCKVNEFAWGNRNAAAIQWLLMHEPIAGDVAEKLCSTFSAPPYPFMVCDTLRNFFAQNAAKKAEFQAAATQAGCVPPSTLT